MYVLVDGFRIRFIFFFFGAKKTQKITNQKTKHLIFDKKKKTNLKLRKTTDESIDFLVRPKCLKYASIQFKAVSQ